MWAQCEEVRGSGCLGSAEIPTEHQNHPRKGLLLMNFKRVERVAHQPNRSDCPSVHASTRRAPALPTPFSCMDKPEAPGALLGPADTKRRLQDQLRRETKQRRQGLKIEMTRTEAGLSTASDTKSITRSMSESCRWLDRSKVVFLTASHNQQHSGCWPACHSLQSQSTTPRGLLTWQNLSMEQLRRVPKDPPTLSRSILSVAWPVGESTADPVVEH